jgi:ferredoxin-nitrite reductase
MNKTELYKKEFQKKGIPGVDLNGVKRLVTQYAKRGWESIPERDIQMLKWQGIFLREMTPGYFMMRVRLPNGIIQSDQLREVAMIMMRFGNGLGDITYRQQIQIRRLRIEDIPEVLNQYEKMGLTGLQTGMDNVRNITGCPVAGLTTQELFDASPLVVALDKIIVGNEAFTNLPRKLNVVITGCIENCCSVESQDIGLIPATYLEGDRTIYGFNVVVGGKNNRIALQLNLFLCYEEAVEVCSQLILIYRDYGLRERRNRARLAYLLDDWGIERLREELERRMNRSLRPQGKDERSSLMSDHFGVFSQKQAGLQYVGIPVPVGRIEAVWLSEIAHLAEAYGTGEIRFTTRQGVIIPNVPATKRLLLLGEPLLKKLPPYPCELIKGMGSCTGMEYCSLAVIETKKRAVEMARVIEAKTNREMPININWSGCSAGCGNHLFSDIGLLGKRVKIGEEVVEAVDIYIGGRLGKEAQLGEKIMENVPCSRIESILESFVSYYVRPESSVGNQCMSGQLGQASRVGLPQRDTTAIDHVAGAETIRHPDQASVCIASLEELDGNGMKICSVGQQEVLIVSTGGNVYAIQRMCPHGKVPLETGDVEGTELICPRHGKRFNLQSGQCTNDPTYRARTYSIKVNEKDVYLVGI